MVSQKAIRASNTLISSSFLSPSSSTTSTANPLIAVFIGGTSGIGRSTIHALVATLIPLRLYLIGRPASAARTRPFIDNLHALNPASEIIWVEAEVSLLGDVRRVCEGIKARERKGKGVKGEGRIDLLFMTPGYAPLDGVRRETSEGVEVVQSLEIYSRILFILLLLPLLNNATATAAAAEQGGVGGVGGGGGRVINVLAGGLESSSLFNIHDLDSRSPGKFSAFRTRIQNPVILTTTLETLSDENPDITFIHSWPGIVDTGNVHRGFDLSHSETITVTALLMAWFVFLVLAPLIRLFAISDEVSAQRHLFQATSAAYGGRGIVPWTGKPGVNSRRKVVVKESDEGGLFLVNYKCDCTPNARAVRKLREKTRAKVWRHVVGEVLGPYV